MRNGNFLAAIVGAASVFAATSANAITVEENTRLTSAATISPDRTHSMRQQRRPERRTALYRPRAGRDRSFQRAAGVPAQGSRRCVFTGMDTLAAKLAAARHYSPRGESQRVAIRSPTRSRGATGPADAAPSSSSAIRSAPTPPSKWPQRLNEARVPVALVVGFGPTRSFEVPSNVARAVNYYHGSSRLWRGRVQERQYGQHAGREPLQHRQDRSAAEPNREPGPGSHRQGVAGSASHASSERLSLAAR